MENHEDDLIEETPRYVCKVAIGWCGIISRYFSENENGETVTVNQDNYQDMIKNYTSNDKRNLHCHFPQ